MVEYRKHNSHSGSRLSAHIVWVTKYRYHVLKGDVQFHCQKLLIEICNSENVQILKVVVSKDHVHLHVEYSPSLNISILAKKLKGRISHHLQHEFPSLQKRYWGRPFGLSVTVFEVKV